MLTAFPIKTRTIIASKFLSMYINNLAFAVVVMVPMAVGYEMWNGFNAGTVAFWFLGILFAPLLPMTIAAAVGMAILAIGAGFKHKAGSSAYCYGDFVFGHNVWKLLAQSKCYG